MERIKDPDVLLRALPLWLHDEIAAREALPAMNPRELAMAYLELSDERFAGARAKQVECALAASCLWDPARIDLVQNIQLLRTEVRDGRAEAPQFSMGDLLASILRRDDPSSLVAAAVLTEQVARTLDSYYDRSDDFEQLYLRLGAEALSEGDAIAATLVGSALSFDNEAHAVGFHASALCFGARGAADSAWHHAIFSLKWVHGEQVSSVLIQELEEREARGQLPVDSSVIGSLLSQGDDMDALLQVRGAVSGDEVRNLYRKISGSRSTSPASTADVDSLDPAALVGQFRSGVPGHDVNQSTPRPLDEVLSELDALIGLASVKSRVRELVAMHRMNVQRLNQGLPAVDQSLHLVFAGPPGTGKTTVARLVAEAYLAIGLLTTGKFREVGRVDLVDGYLGQTALKTQAVIDSVIGGVLFIDEAYSLANETSDAYGDEALATLLKAMEDRRGQFAVIAAGYTAEMERLVASNPGLRSRFAAVIEFQPYTDIELLEMFDVLASLHRFRLEDGVREALLVLIRSQRDRVADGNGRYIRNLFETMARNVAVRIMGSSVNATDELTTFSVSDVPIGTE
jgi:hypothetical protein